jgi:hypothetical protein
VATADEARGLCKVGTWYNSVEETLQKNDMPPNPTEFNPGFLTWPTDGKKAQPVIGGDSHPIAACVIAPEPVRKAQEALMAAKDSTASVPVSPLSHLRWRAGLVGHPPSRGQEKRTHQQNGEASQTTPAQQQPYVHIPDTVSQQAQTFLRTLQDPALMPAFPELDDLAGWEKVRAFAEAPSFSAALICRCVPGAYMRVKDASNAMLKSSVSLAGITPLP